MQQLAYIESEMCYFASVDVRHLMRFCLHDKGGFWNVSWVWRFLNVYYLSWTQFMRIVFGMRRVGSGKRLKLFQFLISKWQIIMISIHSDSILSPPLISGFLVANIIMAQGVAKFFINMSFSSIYVFSSELFPTVIRYCWYSLDIYQRKGVTFIFT